MRVNLSRPAYFALVSSSAVLITFRLVQWRARKRARKTVERVKCMAQQDAPLIDIHNSEIRDRIIKRAIRRASTWMNLSTQSAKPMVGQVGGTSKRKKAVLTLEPEYVLKPLLTDHRGIREISFYEAIEAVSKNPGRTSYASFLRNFDNKEQPKQKSSSSSNQQKQHQQNQQQAQQKVMKEQSRLSLSAATNRVGEFIDTLALAFAMLIQDRVVMESEVALKAAWKAIKKEAELLHKLCKFTAPYYGLMSQPAADEEESSNALTTVSPHCPECPFGVNEDAYLLLQDLTINYKQPCVMDLKMGTETFEPDAPEEKRLRESSKYPQQSEFGFRIVGMRIYDPSHPEADTKGYRFYGKEYGRNLSTEDEVRDALRIYFGGRDFSGTDNGKTKESTASIPTSITANTTPPTTRFKAVSSISQQVRLIRRWFEENTALRFCASSLLIVYEGDVSSTHTPDVTLVRMIDFGRVRRETGGDPGYRYGLRTFSHLLSDLVDEQPDADK